MYETAPPIWLRLEKAVAPPEVFLQLFEFTIEDNRPFFRRNNYLPENLVVAGKVTAKHKTRKWILFISNQFGETVRLTIKKRKYFSDC